MSINDKSVWVHKENMDTQEVINGIKQLADWTEEHCNKIQKQLNTKTGSIMKIKDANKMGKLYMVAHYKDEGCSGRKKETHYSKVIENAKKHADELFEESKKIHEQNKEAIENNINTRKLVEDFMTNLGIKKNYSVWQYKTSRSRNKTEFKKTAGWWDDLRRLVKTGDGFESAESSYKRFMETSIPKYEQEMKNKEEREKRELRKTEAYKTNIKKLIFYAQKYTTSDIETWSDLYKEVNYAPNAEFSIEPNDFYTILYNSENENNSKNHEFVEIKSELEYINKNAIEFVYDFPSYFEEITNKITVEWRHGTEYYCEIKSNLTDKHYYCSYRTQPEWGISECNDYLQWVELTKEGE